MAPIVRKVLLASRWVLLALIFTQNAWGMEVMVIGNDRNPWETMGSLENIDTNTDPGWIQPRRRAAPCLVPMTRSKPRRASAPEAHIRS